MHLPRFSIYVRWITLKSIVFLVNGKVSQKLGFPNRPADITALERDNCCFFIINLKDHLHNCILGETMDNEYY
jgi:hypothetical protein